MEYRTIELSEKEIGIIDDALRDAVAYCGNYCSDKFRTYEREYKEFLETFERKCKEAEKNEKENWRVDAGRDLGCPIIPPTQLNDVTDNEIDVPEPRKCGDCERFGKCGYINAGEDSSAGLYCFEPKKKYRPFKDTNELIEEFKRRFNTNCPAHAMPLVWCKKDKVNHLVTDFSENCVFFSNKIGLGMVEFFEKYTFLDGSVCGIEE